MRTRTEEINVRVYKTEKNKLVSSKKSLEENLLTLERTQTGWIEPFSKWITQAENLPAVAECGALLEQKSTAKLLFGSNLRLSASEASGTYRDPWDFVVRAKNSLKNRESFQNCELLVPLYNQVRTHFITIQAVVTENPKIV